MISNSLDMELQELLDILQRVRRKFSGDGEYHEVRHQLPSDWPM